MQITQTPLKDLLIIQPKIFSDPRGFFFESFRADRYLEAGISSQFVQDNFSSSSQGVLRGLHYQLKKPQAKLVSVTLGEVFDVAVDIRKSSPTFGKWFGMVLSGTNCTQLYIPEGFAHGFYVLSKTAHFSYKCSNFYDPTDEKGVLWSDDQIGIQWPLFADIPLSLSGKDEKYSVLNDILPEFLPS